MLTYTSHVYKKHLSFLRKISNKSDHKTCPEQSTKSRDVLPSLAHYGCRGATAAAPLVSIPPRARSPAPWLFSCQCWGLAPHGPSIPARGPFWPRVPHTLLPDWVPQMTGRRPAAGPSHPHNPTFTLNLNALSLKDNMISWKYLQVKGDFVGPLDPGIGCQCVHTDKVDEDNTRLGQRVLLQSALQVCQRRWTRRRFGFLRHRHS